MPVRRIVQTSRTDDGSATELTINSPDEGPATNKDGAATEKMGQVLRELAQGVSALFLGIVGVLILRWGTQSQGIQLLLGSAVGLVMMAIGFAYATQLLKLAGDLSKTAMGVAKEAGKREWIKVFSAFLSVGAGIYIMFTAPDYNSYYYPGWMPYFLALIGLMLIAAGITFFWMRSEFYKH